MKNIKYVLVCMLSVAVYAQEQLLLSGNITSGGFGGPVVKFSQFDGEWAVLTGGRGAWVVNHTFTLGGGGYSITNDVLAAGAQEATGFNYLQLNYGGPEIGFVFGSDRLVHGAFHTLFGWGEVSYTNSVLNDDGSNDLWDQNRDNVFILEPEANLILNVTSFFRIGGVVSYRITFGLDENKYYPVDKYLDGLSFGAIFKFGKF